MVQTGQGCPIGQGPSCAYSNHFPKISPFGSPDSTLPQTLTNDVTPVSDVVAMGEIGKVSAS